MKGKYLFTSFIMISLIMIVSASCGSSKTDKTSQETPVNYTGENINQLLTYTVPDGYHIDTDNCTDKNEASYTIILSSDDLDEEVFTLEIISYKKQGVSITDDCDIDMDYLLNVSKDSVIKKITLNDTFTVDGHTRNEVTVYWPYDPVEEFISPSQNPVSYLLHALGFKKEQKTIAFEQAYIQNGDYIIGVGVRSFNAVQDIENDVLKKDLYKILNSIKFSGNL